MSYNPEDLSGTGRHLSKTELQAWTTFLDAGRLLEDVLARHLSRDHDMTHSDYEVLVRLDGAGGEIRMAVLAEQVVSSAQKLTHTANRLERRGWIVRQPVKEDGRGLQAVLLEPGKQALARAAGEHADLIRQFLVGRLDAVELQTMANTMGPLAAHMRLHRRGETCEECDTAA